MQKPVEYDLQSLRDAVDGDAEMFQQIVGLLITSVQENLAGIQQAMVDQNAEGIRRKAHLLKGSLLQIAAKREVAILQQLEELGSRADVASASQLWPEVQRLVNELLSAIMNQALPKSA